SAYLISVFRAHFDISVAEGGRALALRDFLAVAIDSVARKILFAVPLPNQFDGSGAGHRGQAGGHNGRKAVGWLERDFFREVALGVFLAGFFDGLREVLVRPAVI